MEYLAVIRYLCLKGNTGKEIHEELADVNGSSGYFLLRLVTVDETLVNYYEPENKLIVVSGSQCLGT